MATAVAEEPPQARKRRSGAPAGARRGRSRGRSPQRPARPRPAPMLVRLCVLVVLPILASTAMALHDGWTPVGDNATLALRAGDVLRGDPPLTGMVSTSDTITDKQVDHPGPLEVWVAAIPYALLGPAGLLLTAAAVNAAALVLSVIVGWRRGGPPMAVAVTATGLLLCWSLGTTVIRDPLNSHVGLLLWFALGLLCWDVRMGHWRSLPVAVVAGSWVAQTHVVYAPMTLIVGVGTAILCAVDHRRRSPEDRRRFARGRNQALIWAVTIGLVLSLPMLIDQFTGSGNLGRMLSFAGEPGQGAVVGIRAVIAALGTPPAWLRPINEPFILLRGPNLADLVGFAITVGLATWGYVTAQRRSDRTTVTLLHASGLTLLAAAVAVVRTPLRGAVLAADPMLLLRPVTAMAWLAIGWSLWRMVDERALAKASDPPVRWGATAIGCVAVLVLVAVTVFAPAKFGGYGEGLMRPVAEIEPQVIDKVRGQQMVQVNATGWAGRLYLRHALIEDLERHGIRTRTGDEDRAFRRGGADRGAPTATIWVVTDPVEPKSPDPDAVLVARADLIPGGGLSDAGLRRRELRRLLDEAGSVQLHSTPQISIADVSREFFRWTTPPPEGEDTLPSDWVSTDTFVELQRHGLVTSPKIDDALVDRIQQDSIGRFFAAEDTEVAVYLRIEPPPAG